MCRRCAASMRHTVALGQRGAGDRAAAATHGPWCRAPGLRARSQPQRLQSRYQHGRGLTTLKCWQYPKGVQRQVGFQGSGVPEAEPRRNGLRDATFRPRVGGLREETSQGRNSQGRDLAGASASAGARLLYYALLDAPTDLATSTVQRPRNLAATAIQTFAHNAIAATVQVDPHWQPGGRVHACRHGHRTEVRG